MNKNKKKVNMIKLILSIGCMVILIFIVMLIWVLSRNPEIVLYTKDNKVNVKETREEDSKQESMTIETTYVTLHYPIKWSEKLVVTKNENGKIIEFHAQFEQKEKQHIFNITFDNETSTMIGVLKLEENQEVNIGVELFELVFDETWTEDEITEISMMQEDINYLIYELEQDTRYTNIEQ